MINWSFCLSYFRKSQKLINNLKKPIWPYNQNTSLISQKYFYFQGFGAIVYWACGFAFAYGKVSIKDKDTGLYSYSSANAFIGHHQFFLMDPDYYPKVSVPLEERVIHRGSIYGAGLTRISRFFSFYCKNILFILIFYDLLIQ